jgi:hypothetical protein
MTERRDHVKRNFRTRDEGKGHERKEEGRKTRAAASRCDLTTIHCSIAREHGTTSFAIDDAEHVKLGTHRRSLGANGDDCFY